MFIKDHPEFLRRSCNIGNDYSFCFLVSSTLSALDLLAILTVGPVWVATSALLTWFCSFSFPSDLCFFLSLVTGKKFFAQASGRTNEAHQDYVAKLKGIGQIQVSSPEECDYIVVFCPIVSRVGTDIGEALQNLPGRTCLWQISHWFTRKFDQSHAKFLTLVWNVFFFVILFLNETFWTLHFFSFQAVNPLDQNWQFF